MLMENEMLFVPSQPYLPEQECNMNLSQDIGVSHNDQQGLCSTDGDVKSLWVTEEAQGMLLIKSNHSLIGSHLKQQRSKLYTSKFIP